LFEHNIVLFLQLVKKNFKKLFSIISIALTIYAKKLDKPERMLYIIAMERKAHLEKTERFKLLIEEHFDGLREKGFKYQTLYAWLKGRRLPSFDNAVKLSALLNLPVSDIPYVRVEINR